ncbi:MAG: hypothetical protein KAI17_23745 [Thiotrichaceae bacterium]|nr:hypothetical protein [Thiotrichaceae bacterium]
MYQKSIYVTTYCLLSLLVMGLSYAEEKTEQTDLRLLITGNTVEGKIIKSNTRYKMYFHPSGKLVRHDSKAKVEKGDWIISKKHDLCIKFAEEKCHTGKKRGDGEFDLYSANGELIFTIDKVILGNPNKYDALTGKN